MLPHAGRKIPRGHRLCKHHELLVCHHAQLARTAAGLRRLLIHVRRHGSPHHACLHGRYLLGLEALLLLLHLIHVHVCHAACHILELFRPMAFSAARVRRPVLEHRLLLPYCHHRSPAPLLLLLLLLLLLERIHRVGRSVEVYQIRSSAEASKLVLLTLVVIRGQAHRLKEQLVRSGRSRALRTLRKGRQVRRTNGPDDPPVLFTRRSGAAEM